MMDGIKLALKLLTQGILFALCGIVFFTIIIGLVCTILGL
jgi:hypothetical protein